MINLTIAGVTYAYPQTGDSNWGTGATGWAQAVTASGLFTSGGSFPLTAEVDFGTNFGLKALYLLTETANPSGTGIIKLANSDGIGWRNSGNSADYLLKPDADGILQYNSIDLVNLSATQSLTNKTITGTFIGTATNATNVATTSTSTNASFFPLFVASSSNGNQGCDLSSSFTYNPSTGTLTATTFSGALSGTATNATNVATTAVTTNASFFPLFVSSSSNGNQACDLATALTYNPSTATFTATNFAGALTGTASGNLTLATPHSHGVLLSGAANATSAITPDASTAKVLVSGGSSADPAWALIVNANLSGSAAISNANLAAMNASTVKANATGGSATPTDVSFASAATASTLMSRDSNANTFVNTLTEGYTTTATAAATTTLTVASTPIQFFTGSTTQTVKLPAGSTLATGYRFYIVNRSSGVVTVQDSAAGAVQTMAASSQGWFTCTSASGTGTWDAAYTTNNAGGGTVTSVTFTGDGTVLSSTPSSAVTTTGTVTASLKTQTARTFLQGPTSGSAATPTFAALTAATRQIFTTGSSATYTTPTNPVPLYLKVTVVGAGSNGGNGSTGVGNGGPGGGAGGTAIKWISSPTTTYTYTVGAIEGGSSSFSTVSATGGSAGTNATGLTSMGTPGAGGVGSGGDINISGGAGNTGATGISGSNNGSGGTGGSSTMGGGGAGGAAGGNGTIPSGFGGGGGGGSGGGGTSAAGAPGIIIVEEFYQ